jgi:hypothetical protein
LWLREDEVKYLLRNSSKGYAATFFEREGIWRSSRGYFRLFRDPGGSKGITFSFNYGDLETKETRDYYTDEKRRGFINMAKLNLAKIWGALECAKLEDIIHAIDTYSSTLRKTTADQAVLYETDYTKGIWRSGGVAYVLQFDKQTVEQTSSPRVGEIKRYSNPMDTGSLVNPYGENIVERLLQEFDPGVGLLTQEARKNGARHHNSISREEAEAIIFRDFHTAGLRYLRGQDPATADEKQLNMTYYMLNRTLQVGIAFLMGAKKGVGTFFTTKGPQARGFAGGVLSSVRYSIVSSGVFGFVLVGIAIGIAVINFAGLLKPRKMDNEALIDLLDPLVQRFSKPSEFINDYQTLMRPVEPAVFESVEALTQHTFDRVPPYGIKWEESLSVWPSDLLEPSLQERGRSIVRHYFDSDVQPSANPKEDVKALKILRTDGIVAVKFLDENRVWGIYTGEPFDTTSPMQSKAPPKALLDQLKAGYVCEITNLRGAHEPQITFIPIAEAEDMFFERFGRPLLDIRPANIQREGFPKYPH